MNMDWYLVTDGSPNITDWLSSIAALIGVPLSLVALVKLIKKDKEREAQIGKLASIAAVLENQTSVMLKHNELVAMQVDVWRDSLLNTNQADNKESINKLREIEEQKLRLSVQPRLWLNGAGYTGYNGELKIDLNNKGEVAYIDDFNLISGDIVLHSKSIPYELEKGEQRYIFGRQSGSTHIKDCKYEIEILYHNSLKHPYRAVIKGEGAHAKLVSDEVIV